MGSSTISNGTIRNGTLGSFSPLAYNAGVWYDASNFASLKDGLNATNNVSQWNDLGTLNKPITQGIALRQPVYSPTSFNSRPGVTFDKANLTSLFNSAMGGTFVSDPTLTGEITVYLVFNSAETASNLRIMDTGYTGIRNGYTVGTAVGSGSPFIGIAATTKNYETTGAWPVSTNTYLALIWDGNETKVYNNGTLVDTIPTAATTATNARIGICLGALYTGTLQFGSSVISEHFALPTALNEAKRQRMDQYIERKWGF